MRRLILAILLLLPAPVLAQPLRVMSFNVRLPIDKQRDQRWDVRLPVAAAAIRRTAPDVIGTQELWKRQGDDLIARLPDYAWFGTDRRGGHDDEHMGVLYNRRTLRLVELGNFWLSDTPDVPGSISWGHPYPRMVTWGVFARVRDGREFVLVNTHLPHRDGDEAARVKGAEAILAWLRAGPVAKDRPVVLTGDFNTTPDSEVYRRLTAELTDAHGAPSTTGPAGTFHAFTGRPMRRIDWILSRGLSATRFETVTDRRGSVQSSDHFPVVADLRFD